MSYDLFIGTDSGVHRLTAVGDQWQKSNTPFASEFHPIAMEYDAINRQMLVSFFRGEVVIGNVDSEGWLPCNDGLEQREVWSLTRNPETQVTYAGTEPSEVWALQPGEKKWQMLADLTTMEEAEKWNFPVPPFVPHVRALACDPGAPEVIYCGIEVGAVLKSEDGGRNWRNLEGVGQDVHRIICSTVDPGTVYVATGDDLPPYERGGGYGFYFSADGGDSWQQRLNGVGVRTYTEDAIALEERGGESILYMLGTEDIPPAWAGRGDGKTYFMYPKKEVRGRGANAVVYSSNDQGMNWQPMMAGLPEALFDMSWGFDLQQINGEVILFLATTAGEIFECRTNERKWRQLDLKDSVGPITHIRAVTQ